MPTEFCRSVIAQCLSNHKETQGSMFGHTERKNYKYTSPFQLRGNFIRGLMHFVVATHLRQRAKILRV